MNLRIWLDQRNRLTSWFSETRIQASSWKMPLRGGRKCFFRLCEGNLLCFGRKCRSFEPRVPATAAVHPERAKHVTKHCRIDSGRSQARSRISDFSRCHAQVCAHTGRWPTGRGPSVHPLLGHPKRFSSSTPDPFGTPKGDLESSFKPL